VQEACGVRTLCAHDAPIGQRAGAVWKSCTHAPIIIIAMLPGLN
jgi:hypothetical protein